MTTTTTAVTPGAAGTMGINVLVGCGCGSGPGSGSGSSAATWNPSSSSRASEKNALPPLFFFAASKFLLFSSPSSSFSRTSCRRHATITRRPQLVDIPSPLGVVVVVVVAAVVVVVAVPVAVHVVSVLISSSSSATATTLGTVVVAVAPSRATRRRHRWHIVAFWRVLRLRLFFRPGQHSHHYRIVNAVGAAPPPAVRVALRRLCVMCCHPCYGQRRTGTATAAAAATAAPAAGAAPGALVPAHGSGSSVVAAVSPLTNGGATGNGISISGCRCRLRRTAFAGVIRVELACYCRRRFRRRCRNSRFRYRCGRLCCCGRRCCCCICQG